MKGNLFIISAPSGAGKTTILKKVLAEVPNLEFSISHTTRLPRTGETDGKDYHFVDRDTFCQIRDRQAFLEWAEVHGNLYGTSIEAVNNQLNSGNDVILDIDTQGAKQLRDHKDIEAVSIFISPPSAAELEKRLTGRGTDSAETIKLRLDNANREMNEAGHYDYNIVNDQLDDAVRKVMDIITSARNQT